MPTTNLPSEIPSYNLVEGVDYEIEYNNAVNIPFWIETGSPFRNQERGEMSGYNAVKRRNASSDFAVTTEAHGLKVFLPRVVPIPVAINTNPVVHTRVRSGSTTINFGRMYEFYQAVNAIRTMGVASVYPVLINSKYYWDNSSYANSIKEQIVKNHRGGYLFLNSNTLVIDGVTYFGGLNTSYFSSNATEDKNISMLVTASGTNPIKSSSVSLSMSIAQVVNGKNSKLGTLILHGGFSRSYGSDTVTRTSITQPSGVTRSTSFDAIMSGMMFANSGTSAFGGGNHMTLQSSSFDQDNIIIAGWIDLQVDNPDVSSAYSSYTPPKYFFDWNLLPSNFQYNNNRGIEVFSTASSHTVTARNSSIIFGVFEDGNNHTPSTTHNALIKHGLDEVLIPKSQIEDIWKNKSQQFFAIKVKSTTGGSKEIEYYLADDSILDGASNSIHGSTEITDGNWTPLGSSSTFTFAKEGHYPNQYAQLLIWNDISWADEDEFLNQMKIIRNNGVGAGWENYNPNNSYKKPIGYWKMDGSQSNNYLRTLNKA